MWPFKKSKPFNVPVDRVDYPYGTFVSTEVGHFLVRDKGRYRIATHRVMSSWNAFVCVSSEAAVKHLTVLGTLGFRDGTLIMDKSNKKEYLISKNKRRHITSPDVYEKFGIDENMTVIVSSDEANLHEDGEVLS